MWATWVVAGVALAGVAFMLRFLTALLREGAPSVSYRVVMVGREPEKDEPAGVLRGIYFHDESRATESDRGDYRCELSENQHYAKEKRTAGLVALGVHPVSVGWSRRSIHPKRGYVFRKSRP
ncbi:MAG: hypothetical protein WAM13_07445 [Candidatus Sulfotelmatobacter sp.]